MAQGSKLRVGARIGLSLATQPIPVRPRLVQYEDVGRTSEDEEEIVKTTEGVERKAMMKWEDEEEEIIPACRRGGSARKYLPASLADRPTESYRHQDGRAAGMGKPDAHPHARGTCLLVARVFCTFRDAFFRTVLSVKAPRA